MGKKPDDYHKTHPVPLGSTDRRCVFDADSLFDVLDEENAGIASLRAEKNASRRTKAIGAMCPQFAPNVQGLDIPLVLSAYSSRK